MRHVTVHTADMEKSIRFYEDIAGLEIRADLRKTGKPIVFLAKDERDTAIELILDEEDRYCGSGISIGFECDDIEEARAKMEEKGLSPTPLVSPAAGTRFFFVSDPNGLNIQFISGTR